MPTVRYRRNQALRKTDGVIKAKANLKTEQAVVTVADDFNLDKLITAVDTTGYKGSINKVEKQSWYWLNIASVVNLKGTT